jgi:hypothetical protein
MDEIRNTAFIVLPISAIPEERLEVCKNGTKFSEVQVKRT